MVIIISILFVACVVLVVNVIRLKSEVSDLRKKNDEHESETRYEIGWIVSEEKIKKAVHPIIKRSSFFSFVPYFPFRDPNADVFIESENCPRFYTRLEEAEKYLNEKRLKSIEEKINKKSTKKR